MTTALPAHPDLGWLKKAAKQRLTAMRAADPEARLHHAQLEVAREHGFTSWRSLKAEVEAVGTEGRLARAAREGDAAELRSLLATSPARRDTVVGAARRPLLHIAAESGHLACVEALLDACADPTRRDRGDRATALHWAASGGHVAVVERLLDAGCDPNDRGDDHEAGPLGWAASLGRVQRAAAEVLLARGAHLDVFAAVCLDRAHDVRRLVAADPAALAATMSRFEDHRQPLHLAVLRGRTAMVRVLLELGADVHAVDDKGRTPMGMVRASTDPAITRLLVDAGADPREEHVTTFRRVVPVIGVSDLARALSYYEERLGFDISFEWGDPPDFAGVVRDGIELYLSTGEPSSSPERSTGSQRIVINLDDVDELHREYLDRGATIALPPTSFEWGVREMHVVDPDGNTIRMGSATEE